MMQVTVEQARQRLHTLPVSLQDAIFSFETAEAIERICDTHGLTLAQGSEVADSIGLVLMGFVRPGAFQKELEDRGFGALAASISDSAQREIFLPFGTQLTQAYAPSRPAADTIAAPSGTSLPAFLQGSRVPPATPPPVASPPVTSTPASAPAAPVRAPEKPTAPAPQASIPSVPVRPAPTPHAPVPQAPAPPAPVPRTPIQADAAPVPVFLHTEPVVPGGINIDVSVPFRFGIEKTGDQFAGLDPAPVPRKPARVELGETDVKLDRELKAFFAQKETPLPHQVNYAPPEFAPADAAIPEPDAWSTMPAPEPERVEEPLAEPMTEKPGILDKIMRKVAPWHYERFTRGSAHASAAIEAEEQGKVVNYAADPAPPAPVGNAAGTAPTPLSLDDAPVPKP